MVSFFETLHSDEARRILLWINEYPCWRYWLKGVEYVNVEKCLQVSTTLRRIAHEFLKPDSSCLWEILGEQPVRQNEEASPFIAEQVRSLWLPGYSVDDLTEFSNGRTEHIEPSGGAFVKLCRFADLGFAIWLAFISNLPRGDFVEECQITVPSIVPRTTLRAGLEICWRDACSIGAWWGASAEDPSQVTRYCRLLPLLTVSSPVCSDAYINCITSGNRLRNPSFAHALEIKATCQNLRVDLLLSRECPRESVVILGKQVDSVRYLGSEEDQSLNFDGTGKVLMYCDSISKVTYGLLLPRFEFNYSTKLRELYFSGPIRASCSLSLALAKDVQTLEKFIVRQCLPLLSALSRNV